MFWQIAMIIIAGLLVIGAEVPYLRRKGYKKELVVFSLVLAAGLSASILEAARIKLPNPLDLVTAVYQPISDIIFSMLGSGSG